ncbi:MAG: hypothetical protein MZV64_24145 [Ignavibacteriales bacterium]|nr:hypothetical protein [Ignavibacteriales bacterium]
MKSKHALTQHQSPRVYRPKMCRRPSSPDLRVLEELGVLIDSSTLPPRRHIPSRLSGSIRHTARDKASSLPQQHYRRSPARRGRGLYGLGRRRSLAPNNWSSRKLAEGSFGQLARQHERTVKSKARRRGSCLTAMIGLHRARRDQRLRTLLARFRHEEFQFAGLVAAEGEPGLVVALDQNARSSQGLRSGAGVLRSVSGGGQNVVGRFVSWFSFNIPGGRVRKPYRDHHSQSQSCYWWFRYAAFALLNHQIAYAPKFCFVFAFPRDRITSSTRGMISEYILYQSLDWAQNPRRRACGPLRRQVLP